MSGWSLEELLPHRPPMMLIDAVESFDAAARSLTAAVTITPGQIFFFSGVPAGGQPDGRAVGRSGDPRSGVPNWVAIEYMAQTSAALAGCFDKHLDPSRPVRPGLLLGTRRLELALDRFEAGKTYRVTSVNAFQDADAAAFECSITDEEGRTVATATLNAYRPPDLERFLREQAAT